MYQLCYVLPWLFSGRYTASNPIGHHTRGYFEAINCKQLVVGNNLLGIIYKHCQHIPGKKQAVVQS